MKIQEIDVLRRLGSPGIMVRELVDIYNQNQNNYRVIFNLVQHPKFPEKLALNIIPHLYSMDLIRVVKNRMSNPFIRQRVETEFIIRYQRLPVGEKLSYLRISPIQVLNNFINEKDLRLLEVILANAECTEELILKFINRKPQKAEFYQALQNTEWLKRPMIADAIIRDPEAPIKIILDIIPLLNRAQLKRLYENEDTHQVVKEKIVNQVKWIAK